MRIRRGRLREQVQQICPEQKDRTDAAVLPKVVSETRGQDCCVFFLVEKRAQTCIINSVCKDFDS